MSINQNLKVLKHIKKKWNEMLMSLTNAYLQNFDVINHTIKHILQFINSDGACARRRGTFPSSHERAAAGGPGGRVRGLQFKKRWLD